MQRSPSFHVKQQQPHPTASILVDSCRCASTKSYDTPKRSLRGCGTLRAMHPPPLEPPSLIFLSLAEGQQSSTGTNRPCGGTTASHISLIHCPSANPPGEDMKLLLPEAPWALAWSCPGRVLPACHTRPPHGLHHGPDSSSWGPKAFLSTVTCPSFTCQISLQMALMNSEL